MRNLDIEPLLIKFGDIGLKLLGLLFVALLPIRSVLVAVFMLVLADFLSGVIASSVEKSKITSSRMRRTIVKLVAYQAAIIFAFVLEVIMPGLPIVNTVAGLIGLVEGKSFFENIRRITGIDIWKELISKLNLPDVKTDKPEDPK